MEQDIIKWAQIEYIMKVDAFMLYVLKKRVVIVWFLFDLSVGSGEWLSLPLMTVTQYNWTPTSAAASTTLI